MFRLERLQECSRSTDCKNVQDVQITDILKAWTDYRYIEDRQLPICKRWQITEVQQALGQFKHVHKKVYIDRFKPEYVRVLLPEKQE